MDRMKGRRKEEEENELSYVVGLWLSPGLYLKVVIAWEILKKTFSSSSLVPRLVHEWNTEHKNTVVGQFNCKKRNRASDQDFLSK